jgi:hypothetical protein
VGELLVPLLLMLVGCEYGNDMLISGDSDEEIYVGNLLEKPGNSSFHTRRSRANTLMIK